VDPSGSSIPNAKVVALQIETGISLRTSTNPAGFFIFPSVQPGRYRVTAESPGMEQWEGDLQLQTGQQAVISPLLKIGATSTKINVAGDVTPLVTTTNPTLATIVERARIDELPLNGRFIQNLLTVTTPGLEGGAVGAQSPQAYGLRDQTVKFVQDGVQINDVNTGNISTRPPGIDTIQEFRVEMSVPSAKYTSPVSAVISTRSGTNDWHGGVFYTGRNNGFGVARQRQDFFTKPPQYILNEYGASLGGPVRIPHVYNGKDRTFFFAAWEGYSLRNASTMSTSLPTQAMQQGDYSKLTDNQNRPITLYNPFSTTDKAQNYSRTPYPGNVIPISQRSPFAAYYYSMMPQPNQPNINPSVSANYFGPDPLRQNDWTFTTRVDHRLGEKDQIFGRFTVGNRLLVNRRTSSNTAPVSLDNY
jgi:Carboxypeptidase regulatory-like domain